MNGTFRQINQIANRHAETLLIAGMIGVGVYNWWLAHHDRILATRLASEQSPTPKLSHTPRVSALVAAWNERDRIDDHLRSFLNLRYPNIELILCAGGTDDTFECARGYACERVIVLEQQPGEGKQHALARCFEFALGEIIYLIDADCVYEEDALLRLLAPLVEQGEDAATGMVRPLDQQSIKLLPSYLYASDVVTSARQPMYIEGLSGANAAITRQALDRIGGLDFAAPTGTDYHLARRLINSGTRIRYVPTSVVPTEYPETLNAYMRSRSRWLRNLLMYGPRYNAKHDVMAALQTVTIGTLMLFTPLLTFAFGSIALMLWLVLIAHAIASKLRYILFAAQLHRRTLSIRLLASVTPLTLVDFVTWTLPVIDLLSMKRRNKW